MNNLTDATVLIVDDNPANLHLLVETLLQEQFNLMVAGSGESALARVEVNQPDLILLDVKMPGIDGFETCRRLQAGDARDIPIIFLSAQTDTVDKIEGFEAGGVDYITKPIEIAEVLARVKTHLTLRKLQQQRIADQAELEQKIAERTVDLNAEIAQRRQSEADREKLITILRTQSEQLNLLTQQVLGEAEQHKQRLDEHLNVQFTQRLAPILEHLRKVRTDIKTLSPAQVEHLNAASALLDKMQQHANDFVKMVGNSSAHARSLQRHPLLLLSEREREVLQLLVEGMATADMAISINVAETTVRTYRQRIMKKLDVTDFAGLMRLAVQHGLVSV